MTTISAPPLTIPGPNPMPLLGTYGNLILFIRNPVAYMTHLYEDYGEIATLARGTAKHIFVFSPEYNQQVLGNTALFYALDADSLPVRIPKHSALARLYAGLHQMNGLRHKQQRQLLMPAFQKKRIAAWRDEMVSLIEQKLASWRTGQVRDLFREMRELTLAIAVKTRLGLDPAQEGAAMCYLLERWISMVFSIPALLLPFDIPGLPYRHLLALSERLEREIGVIVEQKRTAGFDQGDVLSMLLQVHDEDGARLTDEELIGQITTLFVAGHDITARVLAWTLFLLSQHPHVMADLLDELDGKLHGSPPMAGQLGELPLLDGVIKESMRVLPPVLWWSRSSTAPCQLGPYSLPKGAKVSVSHYITHRRPDLYPQPNKFLPERWRIITPGPYEYIPFSAGPRACPGMAVAMMEMKLILSILLQRYRLMLPPRTRIDHDGLMLSAPKQGLPVLLVPQDRLFIKSDVRGNIRAMVDLG
jgi:cytochrome P450